MDAKPATLSIKCVLNGELHGAMLLLRRPDDTHITDRISASPEANPRQVELEAGNYDVSVQPAGCPLSLSKRFDLTLGDGELVERTAEFSIGELLVRVSRNGEAERASITAIPDGGGRPVGSGVTRNGEALLSLPTGRHRVEIRLTESSNVRESLHVEIKEGERAEISRDLETASAKILAVASGAPVNVLCIVSRDGSVNESGETQLEGLEVLLPPGTYSVDVKGRLIDGGRDRTVDLELGPGDDKTLRVEVVD